MGCDEKGMIDKPAINGAVRLSRFAPNNSRARASSGRSPINRRAALHCAARPGPALPAARNHRLRPVFRTAGVLAARNVERGRNTVARASGSVSVRGRSRNSSAS